MEEINKFNILNELKSVYRSNSVGMRKESAAEHTWSALMLADYFFPMISQKLDKLKVYELLMYHDVVEIKAGDTPLHPQNENEQQQYDKEIRAASELKNLLPQSMQEKFWYLFNEFNDQSSCEARFARAVDIFDATIQGLAYKNDWKGLSKDFLVSKKEKYLLEFPPLLKEYRKIVEYLEDEGYFNQL